MPLSADFSDDGEIFSDLDWDVIIGAAECVDMASGGGTIFPFESRLCTGYAERNVAFA